MFTRARIATTDISSEPRRRSIFGLIAYYDLPGLALGEVGVEQADRLWARGGLPKSFLARSDRESMQWHQSFIRAFLERDLPALGVSVATDTMRRFWSMLAHHHAQRLERIGDRTFVRSSGHDGSRLSRQTHLYLDFFRGSSDERIARQFIKELRANREL